MLKTSLLAAAFTLAAASFASAQDWGAQGYAAQAPGYGHAPYGYDNSTSALGRSCPPGYYPHSFPNGNGVRCESPDENTYFDGR